MQYCLYLRKSRADVEAEARGEGDTLKRHEKALIELAKRQKLSITERYREIVSGETISARPVMQHLLAEVEQGLWAGVLVMEVERLARGDTIDQGIVAQAFKYSDTKIITPSKIYDPNNEFDEEYFEFGLFMSRREYKTINRRLQRGRIASVKEGKWAANVPPYGYVRKKLDNQKGYTLEPHPEQADIVKLIFEWYTQGEQQSDGSFERLGASLIATRLNALKVPTYKGKHWVQTTILGILRNPVHVGKVRWNSRPAIKKIVDGDIKIERPRADAEDWIVVDGLHPPLVDEKTWDIAQEYLATNPPKPCPRKVKIKNPLAGLIVCGVCGRKMVRRPYPDMPPHLICNLTGCPTVSSALSIVEERLLDALGKWLDDYKLDLSTEEKMPVANNKLDIKKKAIRKLEEEIETFEKQKNSLFDLLEQGIYTTDMFLERSKVMAERIHASQEELSNLQDELKKDEAREIGRKDIIPTVERVLELYKATEDPATQNNLLKKILEKVVYKKEKGGRWHGKPDEIKLILYPRIPK